MGWRDIARGDVVCGEGSELRPTYLVDVSASLEPGMRALRRGARVHAHHGTREAPARLVPLDAGELRPGTSALAQLRLEAPLVPAPGDRLILRQVAPPDTVGGAEVLDPAPRKHGADPDVVARLRAIARGESPPPAADEAEEGAAADRAAADGDRQAPEPPVLDDAALRLAAILRSDGREPRADADLAEAAGLDPAAARARLGRLVRAGQAVRVGRNLHFHPEPLAELEARVIAICEREGRATIAGVRDELGTSRRYAQAVLEHLDAERVTRRVGDAHVLRARGEERAAGA